MKGAFKELISLIFVLFFVFCFWGFVIVCQSERHTNSFLFRIIKHSTEKKSLIERSRQLWMYPFKTRFSSIRTQWFRFSFMVMMNIYEVGGVWRWLQVKYVREVLNLTIPNDTRESDFFYILRMKRFILKTMNILAIECSKDAYDDAQLSCLILTMCSWGDKMKF